MLAACVFDVERPELRLDIPPSYKAGKGESAPPALDWWQGFHSSELTSLMEEAQSTNFNIAAAIGRIQQADALSRVAGAALLPNVGLNGSASRSRPSQAGTGGTGGPSERTDYQFSLNASYEIDFWGKNLALQRSAEESAIAARFNRDVVILSTEISVGNAYFLVLSSQDRLRIARENIAAAERVLALIRQRAAAGTASALEVAQQETLVATQRATVPLLDQALRQNMASLAVLVGRAPADLTVRGGSLSRLRLPRVTPGLPSDLLLQRPDIRAAEANLSAADANAEAARAMFFPSFSLTGNGGTESPILKLLFTPQSAFYNIAANLTQPIFDGGRLLGNLENAKGRQIELLNTYRQAIVSSFGDVEIALIAVADTARRYRLQQQVVDASRRAFSIAETRLREGTVDLVTVLVTQQTLFQAQDTLATIQLARFQAVLSLFQALGGSWFPPPLLRPSTSRVRHAVIRQ